MHLLLLSSSSPSSSLSSSSSSLSKFPYIHNFVTSLPSSRSPWALEECLWLKFQVCVELLVRLVLISSADFAVVLQLTERFSPVHISKMDGYEYA